MKTKTLLLSVYILLTICIQGCEEEENSDWMLIFEDHFEDYIIGTYPSERWTTRFDGKSAEISDMVSCSGEQSFRLTSYPTWARVEAVPLDSMPDYLCYEGCIYLGQPDKGYTIGLGFKESSTTYRFRNSFQFANDGRLLINGDPCMTWSAETWYKVRLEIDFVNMRGKAWVNDILIQETINITDKEECIDFALCGYNFNSGTSTAYYDDIKIYMK